MKGWLKMYLCWSLSFGYGSMELSNQEYYILVVAWISDWT